MPDANYSANRNSANAGKIVLRASGQNPTTGYKPHFAPNPILIEPPQFFFDNPKPTGVVGEMVVPFNISAEFSFPSASDTVVISDSSGANIIKITSH